MAEQPRFNTPELLRLWAVQYDRSQRTVTVAIVGKTIQNNMERLTQPDPVDSGLIGLAETQEAAEEYANNFAKAIGLPPESVTVITPTAPTG